jgi:excisionase family DNA binding protein
MTVTRVRTTSPPTDTTNSELAGIAREVAAAPEPIELTIRGVRYVLDGPVAGATADVVARLESGLGVYVASLDTLLTTTQAGELLGLSRTYVCRLLDQGVLPHTMRGTHRRVPLEAVQNYRELMRAQTRKALDEVTRITKEVAGYDDDF